MTDREKWCCALYKIAHPVLENISRGRLKTILIPEYSPEWDGRDKEVAYLECFGRLMAGVAPWLALEECTSHEKEMHDYLYKCALDGYVQAVNPDSPDYLFKSNNQQCLVDAAYLVHSFLRGYDRLWFALDNETKRRYICEFKRLRCVTPPYNNWILYSAIIEVFLMAIGEEYDFYRIKLALHKINEWYIGDGWYSDGPAFAFDYYNSFVIQPMYVECLETLVECGLHTFKPLYEQSVKRMQRYSCILERLISPDGYFPIFGRSGTYRTAVFQPLSMIAQNQLLPPSLSNGQVRSALTRVIETMFLTDQNFDNKSFLTLGFNGYQPEIADYYTNTGSLYIASLVFLPLGLPASHPFWTDNGEGWTMKKAWNGLSFPKDGRL